MGRLKRSLLNLKEKFKKKRGNNGLRHIWGSLEQSVYWNDESYSQTRDEDPNFIKSEEIDRTKLEDDIRHLCSNSLLPHLVWETVLKKLPTNDVENCTNASLYFRSVLKTHHEKYVSLPKVFAILAQRYSDINNMDDSYKEIDSRCIPWSRSPLNFGNHRMTGIWKCRLVCKHWNKLIENLHENEDAGHFDLKWEVKPTQNSFIKDYAIENISFGGNALRRHFEASHFNSKTPKNPFLGRSLSVNPNRALSIGEFDRILDLLKQYGHEIWYFSYTEPHHGYEPVAGSEGIFFYMKISMILLLLPNLKVLRLKFLPDQDGIQPNLHVLEFLMAIIPFPMLDTLKLLSSYNVPNLILNHVLEQNQQITELEVQRNNVNGENEIFSGFYANISTLSLEFRSVEDFEKFENYPYCMELKKVQLRWRKSAPFMRWSRIFQALEAKLSRQHCTEVLLDLPIPHEEINRKLVAVERHTYRLDFPNIKHITIFEKLPDYDQFQHEFKQVLEDKFRLSVFNFDLSPYPDYVTLRNALDNPGSVYRDPLCSLNILSKVEIVGSASLVMHQGLKTCCFEYHAESLAAKSFLKPKMQSFNVLPEDDDAIKCVKVVD